MTKIKPYAICSDVHCHDWSAFSTVNEDGVNSRLRIILDELIVCAEDLVSRGGDTMIIAGDLFHVRGSVKPSVINPVMDTFAEINKMGVSTYAIAGNHDLEGKDADALGNAMHSLGALSGFFPVVNFKHCETVRHGGYKTDGRILMLPWYSDLNALREKIEQVGKKIDEVGWKRNEIDFVIHAPLNGVLKGLPDIGFDPAELKAYGFRRFFVGHFHNHKSFEDGTVYSVGATTHQTWGDPGTRAGYCMVYPDRVEWVKSGAPEFVDIKDASEVEPEIIDGNYIRLRLDNVTEAEIVEFRGELKEMGAKGVSIIATKKAAVTARTSVVVAGSTFEQSVTDYVKSLGADNEAELLKAVSGVLSEASGR